MAKAKKVAKKDGVPVDKKVHDYVAKHPGLRSEEISAALGCEGRPLGRVLRRLRASGHVVGKGSTRAMVYRATRRALA